MENKEMYIEPIVMNNKFNKIFIHPIIGSFNESTGRGWFAVSLKDYENQPLENKIFGEEWDIVDATYPSQTKYYTWLKVTYSTNKVPVKVTYNNGTHKWLGVQDLLNYIKDVSYGEAKFRLTEMRVKPYKYTDDYGHNRIAGQLQFIGVEWDDNYYPSFGSHVDIPEEVEEVVPKLTPEEKGEEMVLDTMYTHKSSGRYQYPDDIPNKIGNGHSKTKIEQMIEADQDKRARKKKLMNVLEFIDMEPKEALKILMEEVL